MTLVMIVVIETSSLIGLATLINANSEEEPLSVEEQLYTGTGSIVIVDCGTNGYYVGISYDSVTPNLDWKYGLLIPIDCVPSEFNQIESNGMQIRFTFRIAKDPNVPINGELITRSDLLIDLLEIEKMG